MAHINSFVRLPLLALRQFIRPLPRMGVLDEDRVQMRVWPNDIDFNLHLNNSRFLTCMDYARIHQIARCGYLNIAVKRRWTPLVGSVYITYRRSLPLFAPFEISTRTLCWDDRWFYKEQVFTFAGGLAAIAWVKGLFRDGGRIVPPQEIVDMVNPGVTSPPMPENMRIWNDLTREKLQGSAVEQPVGRSAVQPPA